jgi:hypothetical protein
VSFSGGIAGNIGGGWIGALSVPSMNVRQFDTGLGKSLRALVQDGVIDLLQRMLRENGGYIQAIEPTSVIVRGANDEQGLALILDQLQGRSPAILVATGDKSYSAAGIGGFRWRAELRVHVYFVNNSLRSRLARLVGDVVSDADSSADPGVHIAMEHAEELLVGSIPGGTLNMVQSIVPNEETQLGEDAKQELWHQVYTVEVSRSINAKRDITLELERIDAYHRLADQQQPTDAPIVATQTTVEEP